MKDEQQAIQASMVSFIAPSIGNRGVKKNPHKITGIIPLSLVALNIHGLSDKTKSTLVKAACETYLSVGVAMPGGNSYLIELARPMEKLELSTFTSQQALYQSLLQRSVIDKIQRSGADFFNISARNLAHDNSNSQIKKFS